MRKLWDEFMSCHKAGWTGSSARSIQVLKDVYQTFDNIVEQTLPASNHELESREKKGSRKGFRRMHTIKLPIIRLREQRGRSLVGKKSFCVTLFINIFQFRFWNRYSLKNTAFILPYLLGCRIETKEINFRGFFTVFGPPDQAELNPI